MSIADELLAARNRISDPIHWCQGAHFKFPNDPTYVGVVVSQDGSGWFGKSFAPHIILREGQSIEDLQMCAQGSLLYGGTSRAAVVFLRDTCMDMTESSLPYVNDHMGHAVVLSVFDEAIRRAKDRGL